VELVDLAPTLLERLACRRRGMQGRSLWLSLVDEAEINEHREIYLLQRYAPQDPRHATMFRTTSSWRFMARKPA